MRKLLLLIEICLLAWLLTGSARYEAKKEIPVNTPEFDWENYNIITHALGGIDGLTYLNSRESFSWVASIQSYSMEYGCAAITGKSLLDNGKEKNEKFYPQKNF